MQMLLLLALMGNLYWFVRATLHYHNITSPRALCNDFSRAGFFLEENPGSKKWIIFLESGGFCHSAETCNERFIHPNLRKLSHTDTQHGRCVRGITGEFNPAIAWGRNRHCDLSEVVSPLMTATYRYRNVPEIFPQGRLQIEGRDLLDANCNKNPVFCEYNFVVVPYCSSDLWLGNDTREIRMTGV
jgi:hypothetical protein